MYIYDQNKQKKNIEPKRAAFKDNWINNKKKF